MCLAVPGKVLSVAGEREYRTGQVSFGGVVKQVSFAYVPEVKAGDYVIVHVGFALSVIDEREANQTFEYLQEMGELADVEEAP